ncbi:hypothetical protein IJ096_02820 [Candidatus Saccharibacteria bacterium]|nr:hypothetical protein [Candidatus Saccharibacteria bacterium]
MPEAIVRDFTYVKGSPSKKVQGVKHGRVPSRALAGGNGTFIVRGETPKVILEMGAKDGSGVLYEIDIYDDIKMLREHNVTEKYATEICNPMIGKVVTLERDYQGSLKVVDLEKYI